ncbi:polysaccharide transporter, PST family [Cyclonatronum proteinivorum]|uniref:Polysaccharide transporter, PST family n=1 Tax=Cyclonatronum proteinivorum TaxID=1457365 RepID=A0A345UML6_9BACT|nr:polysaccharide transporter, PST family [Cyclonatronum proteinivorum]
MMGSKAVMIVLHLTFTIVLARLLTPEDFGIVAMVAVFTVFAEILKDAGLSAAAIQRKTLTEAQQSNLYWLNLLLGGLLTLLVAASAPLIAWFYGRPELIAVTLALSLSFTINAAAVQHRAALSRALRFGPKAAAEAGGMALKLIVAVILALYGFGYWALVWATLAGLVMASLVVIRYAPLRIGLPRRGAGTLSFVRFGANVTLFNFANYFHRNLDNLLIGRISGAEALGHYSQAYALVMYPVSAIRAPVSAVALPVLSRLQDKPDQFRAYYLNMVRVIGMLSVPILMFAAVSGEVLIALLLGPGWEKASVLFSILCLAAIIQPAATMRGMTLLALGKSGRYAKWGSWHALAMACFFCIGIWWGAEGVAWAYVAGTYLILYPSLMYVFRDTPVQPSGFIKAILPVLSVSLAAAGLLVFIRSYDFLPEADLLRTGAELLIFMAMVYPVLLAFRPQDRAFLLQIMAQFFSRKG